MKCFRLIGSVVVMTGLLGLSGCAPICDRLNANQITDPVKINNGVQAITQQKADGKGTLKGQLTLENTTRAVQRVQYQVVWQDANGNQVGQTPPWTPVKLYPNLTQTVQLVAPTTEATSYYVNLCARDYHQQRSR